MASLRRRVSVAVGCGETDFACRKRLSTRWHAKSTWSRLLEGRAQVSPDLIAGDADVGYGRVAGVFRDNLTSGQGVGAAVAVFRDGVKVVDLWGGFRNGITKAPWEEDTLVPMMSTTKGVASLAVAVAASQGLISYDAKVAGYWPEFGQAAKAAITVRQLLSHQAGLPALFNPRSLTARAVGTVEGLTSFEDVNREEFRDVEIPAGLRVSAG